MIVYDSILNNNDCQQTFFWFFFNIFYCIIQLMYVLIDNDNHYQLNLLKKGSI